MENKRKEVSSVVVRRLPRYYRYLSELLKNGVEKTSSKALSALINVTASQIRQDFNCFGGFGQQGYGYNVELLKDNIADIMGITKHYKAVIIGVGHLGSAIANHNILSKSGVMMEGLFDISPDVVGKAVGGVFVRHIDEAEEFCRENNIDIAVLTLPKAETVAIATKLANAGVKGFWNFANTELRLPGTDAKIENVHMGDSLMHLCYEINNI